MKHEILSNVVKMISGTIKGVRRGSLHLSLGILLVANTSVEAQEVKSVSVDKELKRLVQACATYARVGKTQMADFSKYGYKKSKLGMVGGNYISQKYVSRKLVDPKSLKRGDGLAASVRWAKPHGHTCEVSVSAKLFHDLDSARSIEAKVARALKSGGFAAQKGKDARGRDRIEYVKGADRLTIYSTISQGRDNNDALTFKITNQNNDARKG